MAESFFIKNGTEKKFDLVRDFKFLLAIKDSRVNSKNIILSILVP